MPNGGQRLTLLISPRTRETIVVHRGVVQMLLDLLFKSEGLFGKSCELVND